MRKEPSAHRALPEPEVFRFCFQVMKKAVPFTATSTSLVAIAAYETVFVPFAADEFWAESEQPTINMQASPARMTDRCLIALPLKKLAGRHL